MAKLPSKQRLLGDWSGTDWLTAIALATCGFFLIAVLVNLLPQ